MMAVTIYFYLCGVHYYNIFIGTLAMLSNPFTERSFPSSLTSSSTSSYTYDRHYFPHIPSNTVKPSFLIGTQPSLPTVYGDMKSPYSTLGAKQQHKERGKYLQNPFHKSSLLEDIGNNTIGPSTHLTSFQYRDLRESEVTPIYVGGYSALDFPPAKGPSLSQNSKNQSRMKKQSQLKAKEWKKDLYPYGQINPSQLEEETEELYNMGRKPSFIDQITMSPFGEGEAQNYQLPSFNSKFNVRKDPSLGKKESIDSPRFNSRSSPPQEVKYTDSLGVQANKLKGASLPGSINYQGRTFYFVNVDEL